MERLLPLSKHFPSREKIKEVWGKAKASRITNTTGILGYATIGAVLCDWYYSLRGSDQQMRMNKALVELDHARNDLKIATDKINEVLQSIA